MCSDAVVEVQCCGERMMRFRKEPTELVSRFPAVFNALSRDHVRPWSSPVKAGQCAEDAPPPRPFPVAVTRAAHLKQVFTGFSFDSGKKETSYVVFVRSIVVVEEAEFSLT